MKKRIFLLTSTIFLVLQQGAGQVNELAIGQWREHIPYRRANSVSVSGDYVYCGTEAAVIIYQKSTGEINRLTTITGLNDVVIKTTKFSDFTNTLVIAYDNGNIDLLKNGRIRNISSIKNANIIGDKTIYNIRFDKELAYLSTGFGIVVLNIAKEEIKDTYLIGENSDPLKINDVFIHSAENSIYAATVSGVRYASLNENLADYNVWHILDSLPENEYTLADIFADTLVFNMKTSQWDSDIVYGFASGTVSIINRLTASGNLDFDNLNGQFLLSKLYNLQTYDSETGLSSGVIFQYDESKSPIFPSQAYYDKLAGIYWIADREYGLIEFVTSGQYRQHLPNGPDTREINDIDIQSGLLWTTSGLHDEGYRASENKPNFNVYLNNEWKHVSGASNPDLDSVLGCVKVEINPSNLSQVWSGSWGNGLIEFSDEAVKEIYDFNNKAETGHSLSEIPPTDLIKVGGLAYDRDGNLWITCSETSSGLAVYTASGEWYNFDLSQYLESSSILGEIIITDQGHKWMVINRDTDFERILVFYENGSFDQTGDHLKAVLSTEEGKGGIPGGTVHCIAQDKTGAIWVGTDEGPVVFYNPSGVFDGQLEGQQIFVEQDGQTQILLETENIKSIAVDGANRKWLGTSGSGVFLMSEDGTEEVSHFTSANSPLFSDEINDIEINHENGEVFFCTSAGLISYKGAATDGSGGFSNVQVYPNPVQQGYDGAIAIRGLADNSNVKITDVNGVLIYETKAFGGQAIWNGMSLTGRKASNGVYLIFCTDPNGENQEVAKLLYLNN